MNIIRNQAEKFYLHNYGGSNNYEEFLQELRWQLNEYRKNSHKLEFIEYIIHILKINYEKHLVNCRYKGGDRMKCGDNEGFENSLFFCTK